MGRVASGTSSYRNPEPVFVDKSSHFLYCFFRKQTSHSDFLSTFVTY